VGIIFGNDANQKNEGKKDNNFYAAGTSHMTTSDPQGNALTVVSDGRHGLESSNSKSRTA
jgi:hypothetical protein